jgi:mono/diheme cytochrome c family protein
MGTRLTRTVALSLLGVTGLFLAGCRQDMHDQPKFLPLRMSDFYSDKRSARPIIEGTVARGQLKEDTYFYTGKIGTQEGDVMPFPVTADVLARGQQRYNIYCSPCHSELGDGRGMIVQRGYRPPPSYHTDRLRKAPIGHFFDVITNGFGAMPDYATQIPVADRWAIAAYIRALQLSQNAQPGDVPPGAQIAEKPASAIPATGTPGSGATEPPAPAKGGETK